MKKFENLGRMLSKDEQRKIKGGNPPEGGTHCSNSNTTCRYYESGTGYVNGHCETNSANQCVCKSQNSSVVWSECMAA